MFYFLNVTRAHLETKFNGCDMYIGPLQILIQHKCRRLKDGLGASQTHKFSECNVLQQLFFVVRYIAPSKQHIILSKSCESVFST